MSRRKIPRIAPGQKISAALLNRIIDAVNAAYVTTAPPLSVMRLPGETAISLQASFSRISPGYTDTSGITARSGTTVGSGTVTLYLLSDTTLTATTTTVTAYNITSAAVASSSYVIIGRDRQGKWWVIVEDC